MTHARSMSSATPLKSFCSLDKVLLYCFKRIQALARGELSKLKLVQPTPVHTPPTTRRIDLLAGYEQVWALIGIVEWQRRSKQTAPARAAFRERYAADRSVYNVVDVSSSQAPPF